MKTVTLKPPGELATEASQAGLLTAESLVTLLKREVRQRRITIYLPPQTGLTRRTQTFSTLTRFPPKSPPRGRKGIAMRSGV